MWLRFLQNKIREDLENNLSEDYNTSSIYNRLEINNQYPHRPNENSMLKKLVENEIDKIINEMELKRNE